MYGKVKKLKKVGLLLFMFMLFFLIFVIKGFSQPTKNQVNLEKIDSKLLNVEGETSVIIEFSKKPDDYKQLIRSLGGTITYDYDVVEGMAVKIDGKNIQKLLEMKNLVKIREDEKVKALLDESAPMISADDVWAQGITGKDVKVCIVDTGLDYTHPAFGSCSIININGTTEPYIKQSSHPYPAYCDGSKQGCSWTITKPGYTSIAVHFVNISIEVAPEGETQGDFLYIKDGNGNIVQTFIGDYNDIWTVSVPGDTINISLVSDWYGCKYGFYIDEVLNGTVSKDFDSCDKVIDGYDFVNNDNDPWDDDGHGTHVAGIISSDNPVYRGIANGTRLLIAKVLDASGSGYSSDVIAGINWCKNNGAQIISMSLGGGEYSGTCDSNPVANAVNNAVNNGIAVSVAAGNSGKYGITTPACASKALAVGVVNKTGDVVGYSSKGPELDIVAPGYQIKSSYPGGWVFMSGTSMATPHATGVIALMLEANPALNVENIRTILNETSDPVNKCYECTWEWDGEEWDCANKYGEEIECNWNATGSGIVNAFRAVNRALGVECASIHVQDLCGYSQSNVDVWIKDAYNETIDGPRPTDVYGNFYTCLANGSYDAYAQAAVGDPVVESFVIPDETFFTINLAFDDDNDGIGNACDNCPNAYNPGQNDTDLDEIGDICDNCISVFNPDQNNSDTDGLGDACDNCWYIENSDQLDSNNNCCNSPYWPVPYEKDPQCGDACEIQPEIMFLSPENQTYYLTSLPLTFTINKESSWIGYSLDNKSNITIAGNTILSGLSYSSHNVIVYTNDTLGNMVTSERVYFAVKSKIGSGGCGRNCLLK
jgi:subtilisin family serine protease